MIPFTLKDGDTEVAVGVEFSDGTVYTKWSGPAPSALASGTLTVVLGSTTGEDTAPEVWDGGGP